MKKLIYLFVFLLMISFVTSISPSTHHNVAVIMISLTNSAPSCSVSQVNDLVFGDTNSAKGVLAETSLGATGINGNVFGPVSVNFDNVLCTSATEWSKMQQAAVEAENKLIASGVSLSGYDTKVYVFPNSVVSGGCNFGGRAWIGGTQSYITQCYRHDVYPHELGHNYGMSHAGTTSYNYGDTSDFMGYWNDRLQQLNSVHRRNLNWLPASKYQTIVASGLFEIAPLELNPSSTNLFQAIKIFRPNSRDNLYISYRQPIGYDSSFATYNMLAYINGVSIHLDRGISGDGGNSDTTLLSNLGDGNYYTDSLNGIKIEQISHTNSSVIVNITLDPICIRNTPAITLSPNKLIGASGDTLYYNYTIKNNDDPTYCQATTFNLVATPPSGWSGGVSPNQAVNLAPQSSASGILSVTSSLTAVKGLYNVYIQSSSSQGSLHSASAAAQYEISASVDKVAPSSPTNLVASLLTSTKGKNAGTTSVKLTWNVASDNVGVTKYVVYRGGLSIAEISPPRRGSSVSYTDVSVVRGTTYSYTVRAKDSAGNLSPDSNLVSITV